MSSRMTIPAILILLVSMTGLIGCSKEEPLKEAATSISNQGAEQTDQKRIKYPEGTYYMDIDKSMLFWEASRLDGEDHNGTVKIRKGKVVRQGGAFRDGEFIVDMSGITESEGSQLFLNHVKGRAYFDVVNFPVSIFRTRDVYKTDDAHIVRGKLTILGETKEITFPILIEEIDGEVNIKAAFDIDRTRWGILHDSPDIRKDLGGKAVSNFVSFALDLWFDYPEN